MSSDRLLSSYDYNLPSELIAQTPAVPRDSSRLLVVNSPTTHVDAVFRDLPNWLQAGDLLVLNNTRVIPARLFGRKSTGAEVEVLLLEERENNCWLALVKPGKRFKLGTEIIFAAPGVNEECRLKATVVGRDEETSGRLLEFNVKSRQSFFELLDLQGVVPLPPYITSSESQPEQYQTVYARQPGAIAAPTAGLHFTAELLQRLEAQGIKTAYVTLHVGLGTFRPVEVDDITTHKMHQEWVEVPHSTVEQIRATKAQGGRVIAVGTTVVRALEGAAAASEGLTIEEFCGNTNLFIYPGYEWRVVDGLITNFHLPGSTLLMLVSALIGRERLLSLYESAIAQRYRFYSFGDAMLILPAAVIK
ncbi:tRNA preQ1(34) S-adenosylmethionine ribosyltransferase-isomerase QueA [Oscillatoria salina]|uniref:tRNA preQ1(34) S-adenosylmethionine ribosyltransferase-isomerase QueA n=1 Tax=Oscillatoria salina TaxID=331517 RepID=UPI001CCBA59B|nr:tRNA preQ1(34) S-adenosylmethionine ribosyltransferase-isomerase QueA [Oscillatoria salina]MBZ8179952.1 tRNA preQ1(34) S-adenosylmethionine ribosyltransferase-isomerase QueA [Oscillatoria salina IIICB1]